MGVIVGHHIGGGSGGLALYDDVILNSREEVLVSIETTLISYTVPFGKKLILNTLVVGGRDDGEFLLKINSTEMLRIRNAWTDRTKEIGLGFENLNAGDQVDITAGFGTGSNGSGKAITFAQPVEVSAGTVVRLAVTNRSPLSQDLYSTIIGEEV